MKIIKELLFGVRAQGEIPTGTTHTIGERHKPLQEWMVEYNVSLVYGKQAVHINS
jgi:hypothetical protein